MIPILSGSDANAIQKAAKALKEGQLVAIPTETVYGLGADADQDNACAAIFETKGRPKDHPLIVHITSKDAARHYAQELPDFAEKLIDTFWPGPLTLILKRKTGVGTAAAGDQSTIGLRCPSHPVAQELMKSFERLGGYGIAAPSANRFGRTSPTTAQHVQQAFADDTSHALALILDGGPCDVGIESTIIDCSRGRPVLLRPGILTLDELQNAVNMKISHPLQDSTELENAPKASGTLASHYAPKAKIRLMNAQDIRIALGIIAASKPAKDAAKIGVYARTMPSSKASNIIKRQMPEQAKDVAHELFAVLHDFDALGVNILWIETPPDSPEWIGVIDRLTRAAAEQ